MVHETPDLSALSQLQTPAQGELLDAIDRLRDFGPKCDIALPQLIVCGDQSAGKSSVLEAISQVAFPSGDGTQTRFASELVLRRSPNTIMNVSIISATQEDREYLDHFHAEFADPMDLPRVIGEATEYMARNNDGQTYIKHTLRAEICGPEQLRLTLVDLPGLIHTAPSGQHSEDIDIVKEITRSYMRNPRAIILAVMAATNEPVTQPVFQLAWEVDPDGARTLGILTKPDLLEAGTEKATLALVRNGDLALDLGWHVLRNRGYGHREASSRARDSLEAEFFRKPGWVELPEESRGIRTLRAKLSDTLFRTISLSLPVLNKDIRKRIDECQQIVDKLGDPRPEPKEQRMFLDGVRVKVTKLIEEGVRGDYIDDFLGDSYTTAGQAERLRTKLRKLSNDFAMNMSKLGQLLHVVEDDAVIDGYCVSHGVEVLQSPFKFTARNERACVAEKAFLRAIRDFMANNSGVELEGDYSPSIKGKIFQRQCTPWNELAKDYIDSCWVAVHNFFQRVMIEAAPEHTATAVSTHIAEHKLEAARNQLDKKLKELLAPYTKCFPMTQNPGYLDIRSRKREAGLGMHPDWYASEGLTAAAEVWASMEAYYEIASYTFIDNIISLGVEMCLVQSLPTIFTSGVLLGMDDEMLSKVASEPNHVLVERRRIVESLRILEDVLRICTRHAAQGNEDDMTSAHRH